MQIFLAAGDQYSSLSHVESMMCGSSAWHRDCLSSFHSFAAADVGVDRVMNDLYFLSSLIERCCKRDINGMAPHLLVSLYTVRSLLLFAKREPNDNNVRLRSLNPFMFCLCIQSSKPKKKRVFSFQVTFQFTSYHFSFFFSSLTLSPYSLPIIYSLLHSGIFTLLFHIGIAIVIVILSHIRNALVRHEMPSCCACEDKWNLDRIRKKKKKSKDFKSQAWNPNRCSYHSTSASTFQSQFSVYRLNSVDILDNIYKVESVFYSLLFSEQCNAHSWACAKTPVHSITQLHHIGILYRSHRTKSQTNNTHNNNNPKRRRKSKKSINFKLLFHFDLFYLSNFIRNHNRPL